MSVSWPRVAMIVALIAGAVACAAFGEGQLGGVFAGAAAGAVVPGAPTREQSGGAL